MFRAGLVLSALVVVGWFGAFWTDDYTERVGVDGANVIYYVLYTGLSLITIWVVVVALAAVLRFVARANQTNRTNSAKPS